MPWLRTWSYGCEWHWHTKAGSPGSSSLSKPNMMAADAFRVLFIHSHKSASERFTAIFGGETVTMPVPLQLGWDPPLHKSNNNMNNQMSRSDTVIKRWTNLRAQLDASTTLMMFVANDLSTPFPCILTDAIFFTRLPYTATVLFVRWAETWRQKTNCTTVIANKHKKL